VSTITIAFSYNPDKHLILHEWLHSLPQGERSQSIRELLECGIKGDSNTLLMQILREIQAIRSQGVHMEPMPVLSEGDDVDVPADILANLAGLGE